MALREDLRKGLRPPHIPAQDIKGEADVLKVTEKLRLDLSNEEAARFFQELINDSVSALFPQITETIHRWAQY